jgi:hypothetical protein
MAVNAQDSLSCVEGQWSIVATSEIPLDLATTVASP